MKKGVQTKRVAKGKGGLTGTKSRRGSKSTAVKDTPDLHRLIEEKAYELFEKRGRIHGNDWEDWFMAERLIKEGHC